MQTRLLTFTQFKKSILISFILLLIVFGKNISCLYINITFHIFFSFLTSLALCLIIQIWSEWVTQYWAGANYLRVFLILQLSFELQGFPWQAFKESILFNYVPFHLMELMFGEKVKTKTHTKLIMKVSRRERSRYYLKSLIIS